ncbi:MAG: hypothetical protein ACOX0N_09575 [Syntrophomonadaceae bacterium]|jgi:hypothetical protein|nr:hypothetical protein [Bacillota bacterium]NLL85700.1 hypothetical protein [Syntrophomonadaceae bacterium]
MLSKKSVIIRYAIFLVCFLLSGTETVTGWTATFCGVFGTIELASALLRYSPLVELLSMSGLKVPEIVMVKDFNYAYSDSKSTLATGLKK